MQHQSISIKEIDIDKYIEKREGVTILVMVSYHKEIKTGKYKCMLCYKQHKKLVEGVIENSFSPNHTMVCGLTEAVKHIRVHNIDVCIVSGIYVGFKSAEKNKGKYPKEVNEIVHIVERQGNTISSIAIVDGMDVIKKYINRNFVNHR